MLRLQKSINWETNQLCLEKELTGRLQNNWPGEVSLKKDSESDSQVKMPREEHSLTDMRLSMIKIAISTTFHSLMWTPALIENSLSEILICLKWLYLDLNMDTRLLIPTPWLCGRRNLEILQILLNQWSINMLSVQSQNGMFRLD